MFGELLFSFDSLKLGISYKAKKQRSFRSLFFSEASTRFELVIEVLQTFALPLGYDAILNFLSDKLLF